MPFIAGGQKPLCDLSPKMAYLYWHLLRMLSCELRVIAHLLRYCLVLRKFWHLRRLAASKRRDNDQVPIKLTMYVVAYLVCWAPLIVYVVYSETKSKYLTTKFHPLLVSIYIFSFVEFALGLSGVANCLVYGLTSKAMRKHYTCSSCLLYPFHYHPTLSSLIFIAVTIYCGAGIGVADSNKEEI